MERKDVVGIESGEQCLGEALVVRFFRRAVERTPELGAGGLVSGVWTDFLFEKR